jgi:hypothetical protein
MTNVETRMTKQARMSNDEPPPSGSNPQSTWPLVAFLLIVVALLAALFIWFATRDSKPQPTYNGPFRLGMTYDEAKKHLPPDNYLSKTYFGDDKPGRDEPVYYTLVKEADGDYGSLCFSADKKILIIAIDGAYLEDESLKVKRSKTE